MSKSKFEYGFLFMYDWIPAFESLNGDDFKELFLALLNKQRCGTPFPDFKNNQVGIYANLFAPSIDRRLNGKRGGEKAKRGKGKDTTQDTTRDTTKDTTEDNIEKKKRKENSIEESERNTPPPSRENIIKELESDGIPAQYIEQRYSKAIEYPSPVETLRSWWATDCEGWKSTHDNFDTNDFFGAALKRSYSDILEPKGGEA